MDEEFIARLIKADANREIEWSKFGSGIYFYRLHAADFVQTRKMVLLK